MSLTHKPYRLFFPLGLLLAWAGVLHWLLHALGLLENYRPVFHSITQVQGFLTCFALGFLFSAIPRRTHTDPPANWQLALTAAAAVGTVVAAWFQRFTLSQFCWLAIVAVLLPFVLRRFLTRKAGRRPPNSFIWVPLSLLMGVAGSVMIVLYGYLGDEQYWLQAIGRALLLQGMFAGLVVGVGGMVLPLLTRGDGSVDATTEARHHMARLAHVLAALWLAFSFVVEALWSLQGGLVMRAWIVLFVLLAAGRIWRPPTVPGWQRWAVWVSAWAIPVGFALAAAFPYQKKAGLHVVFIAGYALMALAVGMHVTLAHGTKPELARVFRPSVLLFGVLVLLAAGMRALVDFDPDRFFFWLGAAAAVFLLALSIWAAITLPRAWQADD